MSAPEQLYTNKNGTAIITPPAIPLHETDIEWVRAARIEELEAENARLRAALQDMIALFSADNVLLKGAHLNATLELARAALRDMEGGE